LGELEKEDTQHENNTATKGQPKTLKNKGKMVECYFFSCNHFVRDNPLKGNLSLLVEEEEE
jgi:hypothetical protein